MVLEKIEVREELELENVLLNDIEQIEKGLRVIGSQIKTSKSTGRLDILCIDAENVLTIIELKNEADEGQLQQALVYFDWVLGNLYWIKDAYKIPQIEESAPRIILIAPEFPDNLVNEAKYLNETVSISLLNFNAFRINGKTEIVFNSVMTPEISEIQEKPKEIQDHYDSVTDPQVKEIIKWTQEEIGKFSPEVVPHATRYGIVMKFQNRNFCDFTPRRSSFAIGFKEEGSWGIRRGIKTKEVVQALIEEKIKKSFALIGGKIT